MSRNGKIARMPAKVREELNRRLYDGELGDTILDWVNQLPETQKLMAAQFDGVPVSKQNLSEWRLGGFQDWLRHRESCELVRELNLQGAELDEAAAGEAISDRLGAALAVELARVSQMMLAETTNAKERWECLQELLGQLANLRREDHRAARMKLERRRQELVEADRKREQEEREKQTAAKQANVAKNQALLKEILGAATKRENGRSEVKEFVKAKGESNPVKPGQTENPIAGATRPEEASRALKTGRIGDKETGGPDGQQDGNG